MFETEIKILRMVVAFGRMRYAQAKKDDRGDIVTTVIIAGLLAVAAIAIIAIIVAKLTSTATNIPTQ